METCIDCNVQNRIMTIKGNIGMQSLECAVQCIVYVHHNRIAKKKKNDNELKVKNNLAHVK